MNRMIHFSPLRLCLSRLPCSSGRSYWGTFARDLCFPGLSGLGDSRGLRKERGFTVTELMVVLGVFAILAGIAIPAFSDWLPKYRLKSAARELYSDFQLAKITAIRSGVRCAIRFNHSVEGSTYDYVLFQDVNNNLTYDTGETVIKKRPGTDEGACSGKWAGYEGVSVSDAELPAIAFLPNGIPIDSTGIFVPGDVDVKLVDTKTNKRNVEVGATGNLKITDPDNP